MLGRWSIGQRLAAGFGFVIVVQVALGASVFFWLRENDAAQERYAQEVLPRTQLGDALERNLLQTSVAWRTYVAAPSEAQRRVYETSAAAVRQALNQLREQPSPGEARARYERLAPLVDRYLDSAREAMNDRGTGAHDDLAELREQVLAEAAAVVKADEGDGARELAGMRENRSRARQGMAALALAAALMLLVIGWFTMQSIRRPARRLMGVARSMQHGQWQDALDLGAHASTSEHNEMAQIARAFGAAAVGMQRRERRLSADATIAGAMGSTLDAAELARTALRAVMQHVDASVGVVYHGGGDGPLVALACEALAEAPAPLEPGQGIPGEALRSGRSIYLDAIAPDTPFAISVGYDRTAPRSIAAVPMRFAGTALGVLVVASLHPIDDEARAFLESAACSLAVGLNNALTHGETQRLLAEVQQRNQVIASQNAELQSRNEEIHAQGEELQAQTEEIHAQNADLRRQAQDLREQALLLRQADEHKNEFIGVLAHELRNPLAAISNSTSLLDRLPPESDGFRRSRQVIERQVRHLTRLIEDLLDVTRISRGKVRLRREPLDLAALARDCCTDHRSDMEQKGITVALDIPPRAAWVYGDRTRLAQVIGNLLSNAAKFTPSGGRVELALRAKPGGSAMTLNVRDDGCGIDARLLDRLFEPFSQGLDEQGRNPGGLGLGLALVKGLVEMHGGSVEARSEGRGKGAEFVVRLPQVEAPADAAAPRAAGESNAPAEAAALPKRATPAASPRQVLIVEDNPDGAQSLKELVAAHGHRVEVAGSGPEALAKAVSLRPDVVLCDVGLPGMDGYELARNLRAHPSLANVTLIAVTGYATELDRQRAWQAGFDAHVAKPPDARRLMELLDTAGAEAREDL